MRNKDFAFLYSMFLLPSLLFKRRSILNLIYVLSYVQEDIFQSVGVPLVRNALAGYNTTILSFGQVHLVSC